MKKHILNHVDLETESDYLITLTCIKCGDKSRVSGHEADYHEIDNTNFICEECNGYDPTDDLPGGHPAI